LEGRKGLFTLKTDFLVDLLYNFNAISQKALS